MKTRQRQALLHPVPYTRLGERAHKNRVDIFGKRISILDVREAFEKKWVWQASVSYRALHPGPKHFGLWTQAEAMNADILLMRLLEGVGDQVVLRIQPIDADLVPWIHDDGLDRWDVINDADAMAWVHKSLGFELPTPPWAFTAMHIWKTLTEAELKAVTRTLEGRSDPS